MFPVFNKPGSGAQTPSTIPTSPKKAPRYVATEHSDRIKAPPARQARLPVPPSRRAIPLPAIETGRRAAGIPGAEAMPLEEAMRAGGHVDRCPRRHLRPSSALLPHRETMGPRAECGNSRRCQMRAVESEPALDAMGPTRGPRSSVGPYPHQHRLSAILDNRRRVCLARF